MNRVKRHTKRVLIGVVGGLVLMIGIILIPYPGPGWLIVFAGLAILATEFDWAQRLLVHVREQYENWMAWLKRQHLIVKLLVLGFTGIVVIVTVWLLNGYGLIDNWLGLNLDWVHSPLLR